MRLLKLPEGVLDLIGQGKIGFSEARVLLEAGVFLDSAGIEELARNAVALGWTVKELKAQLTRLQGPLEKKDPAPDQSRSMPMSKRRNLSCSGCWECGCASAITKAKERF